MLINNRYGRHSKSIDTSRKVELDFVSSVYLNEQRCGVCGGMLTLGGRMQADGTPARVRAPSAFAQYTKACKISTLQKCSDTTRLILPH